MNQTEAIEYIFKNGFKIAGRDEGVLSVTDAFKLIQLIYNDFSQDHIKKEGDMSKGSNKGTLSNYEASAIIENEGIGYAVQHYISGEEFKDPATAKLWLNAEKALNDLKEYLEEGD